MTNNALARGNRAIRNSARVKRLFVFALTFLMLIPMQVKVAGVTVGVALLVAGCLALRYLFDQLRGRPRAARELRLFCLLFGLAIYFLFIAVLGRAADLSMVVMCLYGATMYAAALVLVDLYRAVFDAMHVESALKCMFSVGLVHSVVQIAVLASEPFANAIYSVVTLSEDSATHISQGYRSPGLFASGAAILGTFNAMVLVIGIVAFLRTTSRPSWTRLLLLSIATILQVVAIAVSGRTGFVALGICIVVVVAYQFLRDPKPRLAGNLARLMMVTTLLVGIAALRIGFEEIEQNLRWSFEFVYSLLEGQGLKTESTTILFGEMFFLPDGLWPLLFGTANFGRSPGLPYVDSDAGYVLMVFGGGFVGAALTMSVFIYVLGEALASRRHVVSMLLVSFVVAIFVINMKDFYFLQNSGATQIIMICLALLHSTHRPLRAAATVRVRKPPGVMRRPDAASAAPAA